MKILRFLHQLYKRFISPMFGCRCRFHPTCSDYSLGSLERHGMLRGGWYSMMRFVRCHPFCEGGFDPVPEKTEAHRKQRSLSSYFSTLFMAGM